MGIIRIRASSLSRLLDCPMSWEGTFLKKLHIHSQPAATIGSSVHYSTAAYDAAVMDGDNPGIDETAALALDYLRENQGETDWLSMSQRQAEVVSLRVHKKYCQEVAPQFNYVAVEAKLSPLKIDMGDGMIFELTGTLDRINDYGNGKAGVVDAKTGKTAVTRDDQGKDVANTRTHGPQTGVYDVLGGIWLQEHRPDLDMTEPPCIIGLQTTNNDRVGVGWIKDARSQVLGSPDHPGYLEYVAQYFRTGLFPPNPQSWICGEKYCSSFPTCPFHG